MSSGDLTIITMLALALTLTLVLLMTRVIDMYLAERELHHLWHRAYVDMLLNGDEITAEVQALGIDRIGDDVVRDERTGA